MSYILDALKRAERERKQGQVSVLDEIPATAPAQAPVRRLPRWALPAAAVVIVVVAASLLIGRRHHAAPPAAAPPALAQQQGLPPRALTPAPPAQFGLQLKDAGGAGPPATAQLTDNGKMTTLADLSDEPAPAPKMAPPPAPAASAGRTAAKQSAEQPAGGAAVGRGEAGAEDAAEEAAEPGQESEAPAGPTAMAPPAEPQQAAAAPSPAGAQQLIEMPDAYRAQFPQFSLDVLAYNNEPKRRFVLINGHQYHEGDTLVEGPMIVEIKPNGVVFDWQGQRVLYAAAR